MEFVVSEKKGPIFKQIADYVVRLIATGGLMPGGKLPSTRDLALSLNVNPNTVVAAYKYLETEGIAETRRGLGTFAKDSLSVDEMKHKILKEFAQEYLKSFIELGADLEKGTAILTEVYNEHYSE